MSAFQAYMNRQLGPPLLSGDEDGGLAGILAALGNDDVGARGLAHLFHRRQQGGHGRHGGGGGQHSPQLAHARRLIAQHWRQHGLAGLGEDDMGALGAMLGGDDDEVGDDQELDGDEMEVEGLGGDDEDVVGDDGEMLGASVQHIEHRIHKLEHRKHVLEAKLMATPEHKFRKRARLRKMIARIRELINRKQARKQKKIEIMAAKMGVSAAALSAAVAAGAAGGGAGAVAAIESQLGQAAASKALNMYGIGQRSTPAGQEVRLAFNDATTGAQVVNISVVAGAGLRTANISMVTPIIPFAEFEVVGIDTNLTAIQGQAAANVALANEMLIKVLLSNITVGGGINLLYTPQNAAFGGQTIGNTLSSTRTIAGLRQDPCLEQNNTATLTALFRQEITTTVTISATFEAALVVNVLKDKQARRAA